MRLKNVSKGAIPHAVALEFAGLGSGEPESDQEKKFRKDKMTNDYTEPIRRAGVRCE